VRLALHVFALLVRALVALLLRALAPPRCAACDAALARDVVFCPACACTVRPAAATPGSGPVDAILAAALYGGALERAVHRFKYERRPDLARPLGHLVRAALRSARDRVDLVVPVPLHPRRLADRGYNQAALLAAHVAAELGAPHAPRALVRVRATRQQARCTRVERLANVERAFAVRPGASVAGRVVALVDDVATTGATLDACAIALREAGAARVVAVVIARAESP
jgi:ComF family protein